MLLGINRAEATDVVRDNGEVYIAREVTFSRANELEVMWEVTVNYVDWEGSLLSSRQCTPMTTREVELSLQFAETGRVEVENEVVDFGRVVA